MERIRPLWQWIIQPHHLFAVLLAAVPFFILMGFMDMQARNIPRFDQYRSIPIALAVADGELTPLDLLRPAHGHVTAFTFAITAVNTWLTDWDLRLESYITVFFAALNYILYLLLFHRTAPKLLVYALVPFSMMVFSVQQDFNWITPYESGWHISIFWYLLGLVVLAYRPAAWWALWTAALFCVFATFSHGNGFVGWGAVLVYLLLSDHRRWLRVGAWLAVAVPSVLLFLYVALPTADEGEAVVSMLPLLVRLWNFVVFAVGFQGAVFSSVYSTYGYAVRLGMVGLVLLAVNGAFLLRHEGGMRALRHWLPMAAYGFGVGLMVAVTRLEQHEPERIFLTWYTTASMLFWLGVFAVGLVASASGWTAGTIGRGVFYLNLIAVVFFAGRYVVANYNDLRHPYAADQVHRQREDCYMRYIFRQTSDFDPTCIFPFYTEGINQLAARRLSVFATRPPESIITDDSDRSIPVLVESGNPWINRHVQDYFLDGVDPARVHHLYTLPPDQPNALPTFSRPLENAYPANESSLDALLETFGELDTFWYITRAEHETDLPEFWEVMVARDYAQVDVVPRNEDLIVSRYVRVPQLLADSPRFGDVIRLRAVTDVDDVIAPCDTLRLQSFWETEETLPLEYSANLVLLDETGNGVATSDARLSTVGSHRWNPETVYYDDRTLGIPCELPPGEYTLMFGIYYYQAPNDKLPVTDPRSDRADLAFISQIEVTQP